MSLIEVNGCIEQRHFSHVLILCLEALLWVDRQTAIQDLKANPFGHLKFLLLGWECFANADGLRNGDPARSVNKDGVLRFEFWENYVVLKIERIYLFRRHLTTFLFIFLSLIILDVGGFSQSIEVRLRRCPFLERVYRRYLILHFFILNIVFLNI